MTHNDAGMHYLPCQYIFSNTAMLDPFYPFSFSLQLVHQPTGNLLILWSSMLLLIHNIVVME
jgi:hypothetical protein